MIISLSDDALAYGETARAAFAAAGTDELAGRCAADPALRATVYERVLADLGAWDLRPRDDPDELEAAAALCRAAGWAIVDHPVAERLSHSGPDDRDNEAKVVGSVVVDADLPRARLAGLTGRWEAVTLEGARFVAAPKPARAGGLADPALVDVELAPIDDTTAAIAVGDTTIDDAALGLVLGCWTLLGHLDRAMQLTCDHVRDREQFGRPLAKFQGVQFALTEAEVERAGVEMLANHALWSVQARNAEALDDALALRLAALEAAEIVFGVTHQLHGAIGFCDETLLSWVSRVAQPLCRAPLSAARTADVLTRRIDRIGLVGLFGSDRVR